ncbi:MAG: hypothetical protein HN348_22020, partial [Proteobacteria bacterium]|nr:hypothetical protein [Pseudomonadota bacterium]
FLKASLFYEMGIANEALGRTEAAMTNFQVVIDVADGLSRFSRIKRLTGWLMGYLSPNNEIIVKAFARLAQKRMDCFSPISASNSQTRSPREQNPSNNGQ